MRYLLGIPVALVALVALACTSETTIIQREDQAPGISVTGEGSAFGEPDVAVLTLGVEAEATTVSEARAQASESMNAMIDALKQGGVADEDVQTARFSVQPRYDFSNDRQEIIGFFVSNIATVKVRDIDRTGELLDAAIEAGGDRARVENLMFTIDDPTALEGEAREAAMAEAKAKAEALAGAGGVELGKPRSISEGGGPVPLPFDAAALRQAEDAQTPIELGELEVRVLVTVVYEVD